MGNFISKRAMKTTWNFECSAYNEKETINVMRMTSPVDVSEFWTQ